MIGENNRQGLSETFNQQASGWTVDEKKKIASIMVPLIEVQNAYGKTMDAKIILRFFETKLSGRFSVDQIIHALDVFTDLSEDFPTPANLIKILEPAAPEITEAQYVTAKKWQERNRNWSPYTPEGEVVRDYNKQNERKKEKFVLECEKMKSLVASSVKRIK